MTPEPEPHPAVPEPHPLTPPSPLPTRALTRESARVRRLLATGAWCPSAADAHAAAAVLTRLTAPLPSRRAASVRTIVTDRDRRLQRVLRATLHHLDAHAVDPPVTALLAAVARALLPWHAAPKPPAAAAAPRYGELSAAPPTAAGEALLPALSALFTELVAPHPPTSTPRPPATAPWQAHHPGRFRHYGRPAPDVWTARTFACPACGDTDGPWTVTSDWRLTSLRCPCGATTHDHGLALSEIWLLLPDE
ncbi:hypothetical protein ACIP93_20450 [Streptomyces sp. NPDC088745]|uniref:hypothetical protein n=1 Tax=Streptomyces sp. NPDC088745 TaxID=3365884 RepID=UPI003808E074